MMIEFVTGDFFDYEANTRVNTVNCVGVMGAGVALTFKNKYPEMFKNYVLACKNNDIAPGKPHVWTEIDLVSTVTIINFPTKIHWKNPSQYEYIEKGLIWLENYLADKGGSTVTLPALGCGHGGLDWNIVKEMIVKYLGNLETRILVFNPTSSVKRDSNVDFGDQLAKNNVTTISPIDKLYPKEFVGRSSLQLYCIGNTSLLKEKKLSVLVNSKSSEKEYNTLIQLISEIPVGSAVLLLSLKNQQDYDFANIALLKGFRVMFIIPYGILKFKVPKNLLQYWDENKLLLISITTPDQDWKKYESANALKFRQKIADLTLINSLDLNAIKSFAKYFNASSGAIYYINYWLNEVDILLKLKAKKIGVNKQGQVNILSLLDDLDKI